MLKCRYIWSESFLFQYLSFKNRQKYGTIVNYLSIAPIYCIRRWILFIYPTRNQYVFTNVNRHRDNKNTTYIFSCFCAAGYLTFCITHILEAELLYFIIHLIRYQDMSHHMTTYFTTFRTGTDVMDVSNVMIRYNFYQHQLLQLFLVSCSRSICR